MYQPFSALSERESFDVCVIGAGAAGITVAMTLARQGRRVLLCEGGEASFSERSQALYRGDTLGDTYLDLSSIRLRYMGGSTNHWGGVCRPLDAHDFTAKQAAPQTAWPIGRGDLDPYFEAAAALLDLEEIPPDTPVEDTGLERVYFSLGPPTRMKDKFAATLNGLETLTYCLTANLVGLSVGDGRVEAATFSDFDGQRKTMRARSFVLACGGIENARLLLWCNAQSGGRLVPDATTLGRYWMEHPHATIGQALLFEPARLGLDTDYNVYLSPTPRAMSERGILNCGLRLHRMAPEATRELIQALAAEAPGLEATLAQSADTAHGVYLRAAWEQEPRFDNAVELMEERDELGVPRSRLVWQQSALDRHTIRESLMLLGEYLLEENIGRVQFADWLAVEPVELPEEGEIAGRHHMGGTRMSDDARRGIVDRDCRLFAQANMFVAGSSVFASAGHANPTLTIVQLALRLGVHIDEALELGRV
ncbi:GMC family oxidoreductase [Halomonas sp. PAMB 3264]|uniref:GMC family oxidoreductase n=1 Tax=Halomonas sp. PAMB 3264 TaxID=3075222 RepID=UPI00289E925C|nr:GMC family oxidoreductase [Halomonas sp. PAMB 3264]WNL43130.1 GMC family oxidoreductase [Halomonas sp. PAMB 3264]